MAIYILAKFHHFLVFGFELRDLEEEEEEKKMKKKKMNKTLYHSPMCSLVGSAACSGFSE